MQKLTLTEINKIALYVPFGVQLAPLNGKRTLLSSGSPAQGIIGATLIMDFDEDDGILESSDLSHHANDDRPVLRHLKDMTDVEFSNFKELTRIPFLSKIEMAIEVQGRSSSDVFFYAISRHFDLFGLIDSGQAIAQPNGY